MTPSGDLFSFTRLRSEKSTRKAVDKIQVKRNELVYRPVCVVSTLLFDRQLQVAVKAVQDRLVIGLVAIS